MFTLLDSFTILVSSLILVSPAFILIFIIRKVFPLHLDKLAENLNGISLLLKAVIFDKYIMPKLFNDKSAYRCEHSNLMTVDDIKSEICNVHSWLEEEDINYEKREVISMRKEELYKYLTDLRHTREVINGRTLIKEATFQMIALIQNQFNGKQVFGETLNLRNLEPALIEKVRQMEPVITDISELIAEKNMSPIGKLLFSMLSTTITNHMFNKVKKDN